MRSRWLLWGLAVLAVVAIVAGVVLSGDSGGDAPDELVDAAPAAIAEAGTADIEMTVAFGADGLDAAISGRGMADFAGDAGWFETDVLGTHVEMRTDGHSLFVRSGDDPVWLAADAAEASSRAFGAGPVGALALVDLLRGATADVDDLGAEEVRGVDTRHVRIRTDVDAVLDQIPAAREPVLEGMAALSPDGPLPVDVWLADDALPHRLRLSGEVEGITVTMTVELSDFGGEIDVPIPPEGEIRTVEPEELGALMGGVPG